METIDSGETVSKAIPLLSFFTGGGFMDIGFEQAGFKTVWTNEHNPVFASMYAYGMTLWRQATGRHILPARITNTRNVQHLSARVIEKQAFPQGKPLLFGVIGGPPCPDFSSGGRHQGGNGLNGRLTKTYVNRITSLMPQFFVFENVAGLYRIKANRAYLQKLEEQLQTSGYCLDLRIMNALEMGVPQDRERLIMVGVHQHLAKVCASRMIEKAERNWFPWPELFDFTGAKTRFNWPQKGPFGRTPLRPNRIPYQLTVASAFRSLPSENKDEVFNAYSERFKTVQEGDTKRKSFKRLHRYRYSPTACYGHNEVHLHPWKERRLSVREAMRIQGIPDEYSLQPDHSLSAKFAVVSNGVPVPLAFQVAKSLKEFLRPALKITR
ncbi:MAG: DNA cytosine methyltransferase [Nitrospira sp. SB0677_bin_15]|nr:DNA cytosine methyltransferase [Nitrospira sp. SB0667_bin_9]MYD30839.1 DNA cytosine methyltransferase [Nitrospira sp. SB0661_bin_20]MYG40295.1 DNA cytosine methyltransferase [Nitrospira sp. SB0677_bin_15]MYH01592.1 DNA cytosine methyltransferase [Nitrospira sp. SB0675_bin_23]